ncbi:MAG: hypothetical protein HFI32_05820 [Lachnospiraceae bacterium]|nr:hypothetical protein [Lachnospiraceae bacterium]
MDGKALQDAFVFTCDRMRHYEGDWHLEQRLLFPGLLFLESQDKDQLCQELERDPEIRQLLGNRSGIQAIDPEVEGFLRGLCGASHHSGMSRGYIRDGQTFVTEGPLRGKESLIRKIDRHKRVARIGMDPERKSARGKRSSESKPARETMISERELQVGLEIVTKS